MPLETLMNCLSLSIYFSPFVAMSWPHHQLLAGRVWCGYFVSTHQGPDAGTPASFSFIVLWEKLSSKDGPRALAGNLFSNTTHHADSDRWRCTWAGESLSCDSVLNPLKQDNVAFHHGHTYKVFLFACQIILVLIEIHIHSFTINPVVQFWGWDIAKMEKSHVYIFILFFFKLY